MDNIWIGSIHGGLFAIKKVFIIGNMFKMRELHSLEVKYVDTSSVSSYPKLVVFFKKIKNDIVVEPGIFGG